jgi:glutaredoxin
MNVKVYATSWCRDCRLAKQFLDQNNIEYTSIDVDADKEASAEVIRNVGKRAVPQLVIDGKWFQPYIPGKGLKYDEMYEKLGISRP